jgi:hypothetical protein
MPALVTPQGSIASTIQEKAEALRARFYPIVEADLSDIKEREFVDSSFPQSPIQISQQATQEEVEAILRSRKPWKAPGMDGVPNGFLRAMGTKMA